MKKLGTVAAIARYPVKSMGGESLHSVALHDRGIAGDRAWAVRDEVRGGVRGAKRFPQLMQCSARYPSPPQGFDSQSALLHLPDGREFDTSAKSQAESALSDLVGGPVTLWPLLPASNHEHYKRGAPASADPMTEWRNVFARTADEPLPDLSKFPQELMEYESPLGTYFDAFPLLLVSNNSLDHLNRLAPQSRFDVRRFRPNLLLDLDSDEPFSERAWCGRRVRVGGVVLEITLECPRCVMTTHAFADLPKDPKVMRTLVKEAGGNLGVYARIHEPGHVAVGDPIELLD